MPAGRLGRRQAQHERAAQSASQSPPAPGSHGSAGRAAGGPPRRRARSDGNRRSSQLGSHRTITYAWDSISLATRSRAPPRSGSAPSGTLRLRVDDTDSAGLRARHAEVGVAHALEEPRRLLFEAIRRLRGAGPLPHALETRATRADPAAACSPAAARLALRVASCSIHSLLTPRPAALVSARRIREPIAHHPLAARQRRSNEILHMQRRAPRTSAASR